MASNAPWSVKGIDPKTRETAKEFARRSGMTLGEWLNQRILEEGGMPELDPEPPPAPHIVAKQGSAHEPSHLAPATSSDVVAGLSQRLESIDQRSTLAVTGLDQSVRGVLARLEAAERAQVESRMRMDDRVRKIEEEAVGPRSVEAIRTLEGSFSKVANRVNDTEARLSDGLDDLRREVTALGRRLEDMERAKSATPEGRVLEQRMEQLAVTLSERVEAAKAEMAASVVEAAEAAGAKSANAVERIGHEVLRMAEALDRRVAAVEHSASDAIEQVGGEVTRAMSALDGRMQRSETLQVQALEKLSGEIARITERLSERIGNAERRSAQAIDDVGEQVSRVTERLNSRYDRASSDLAERIRQSEERTARLLEDAKERIDARLAEAQKRVSDQPAFMAAPEPAPVVAPFGATSFSDPYAVAHQTAIYPDAAPFGHTFAPAAFVAAEPDFVREDLDAADDLPTPLEAQTEADFMAPAAATHDDQTLEVLEPISFASLTPSTPDVEDTPADFQAALGDDMFVKDAEAPVGADEAPFALHPHQSTREMIEQARAAARAASQGPAKVSRELRQQPQQARRGGLPFLGRKKADLKNALMMSVAGLALVVAAGGYVALSGGLNKTIPPKLTAYFDFRAAHPGLPRYVEIKPQAAVALDPRPIEPSVTSQPSSTPSIAPPPSAAALYSDGAARIEAGDKTGLASVQRAANLGMPAAQAYLGRLYEKGDLGLTKDPVEARQWYERAANAGDRSAMHNLALYYFEGSGGPKNVTVAAEWFRKAANAGLVDSQYNLGRLYENGLGVSQNTAEAYKWYILASRSGTDQQRTEARQAAARMGGQISAAARASAEKSATEIAAAVPATQPAPAEAAGAVTLTDITAAQKTLIRLGYFKGVADGQMTAILRLAVQDYQHDKNLPATGQLDLATANSLSTYNR
jgi:localization factor PodJL